MKFKTKKLHKIRMMLINYLLCFTEEQVQDDRYKFLLSTRNREVLCGITNERPQESGTTWSTL
ncbi:unnamed protein product [Amoebophrya sp. A25]|nr:unnamed protein product [Amoebophrya sp. A25]|eukprot:GSA25T00027656001.1